MLNGLAGRDRRLKKSAAPASSDIQHFTDGLTFMSLSLDAAKALLDGGIDAQHCPKSGAAALTRRNPCRAKELLRRRHGECIDCDC